MSIYLQLSLRLDYTKKMNAFNEYMNGHRPFIDAIIAKNIATLPKGGQDVASHIMALPGKGLRPALLVLSASAFGFDFAKHGKQAYSLAAALELVHCASLLHDDMEDDACLRRGCRAAHTVFGAKGTLLAGDALLALATSLAARQGGKKIVVCFTDVILGTVCGQIQGLAKSAELGNYIQVISAKTGSLMAAGCKLGAILAKADAQMAAIAWDLGLNLGIAYQLVDDWLDFLPSKLTGKTMALDLTQGNFTLPIRFFVEMLGESEKEVFYQKFITGQFSEHEQVAICKAIRCSEIQKKMTIFSEQYLTAAQNCLSLFPQTVETQLVEQVLTNIRQNFRGLQCPQK